MDAKTDEPNSGSDQRPQRRAARSLVLLVALCIALGTTVVGAPAAGESGPEGESPSLGFTDPRVILAVAVILASLLAIAFLSLAELSMVSVNRARLKRLAEDGDGRAQALQELFADEDSSYLSGIMTGIAVLIIILANATAWVVRSTGYAHLAPYATAAQIGVTLLVGEIIPKTMGAHQPERYALALAYAVRFVVRSLVFRATLKIMNAISRPVSRLFGVAAPHPRTRVSQEELEAMADVAEEEGVLEASEAQMIDGIISFRELTAREIMVSRMDVVAIEANCSIGEAADTIAREGKSRVPIYEADRDHIVGVLYANDVLARLYAGDAESSVGELARQPLAVPETMRIDRLFRELQQRSVHIAIVIDEHGGFDGIVTVEDILEEIVGGIHDEHDTEEELIIRLGADEWRVQASTPRHELEAELDIELPEGDFDTVAGFLATQTGSLPGPGERIVHQGFAFVVGQVNGPRIRTLTVKRLSAQEMRDEDNGDSGNG
jgi:putative hemolysin